MSEPGARFTGQAVTGYIPNRRTLLRWLVTGKHSGAMIHVDSGGVVTFCTPVRLSGPLEMVNGSIQAPSGTNPIVLAEGVQR